MTVDDWGSDPNFRQWLRQVHREAAMWGSHFDDVGDIAEEAHCLNIVRSAGMALDDPKRTPWQVLRNSRGQL